MPEIQSAAFSVSVDNEAEIKAWLADFGVLRDAVEVGFNALLEAAQNRPLIRLTIHHQAEHNDGADDAR
jgi:hypothetical protein